MNATIELGDMTATIEGWEWEGSNKHLVALLNSMLDPDGPSGGDPAPNTHEARRVARLLGAKVVDFELPSYDPEAIY
jgi:hypothetical protein